MEGKDGIATAALINVEVDPKDSEKKHKSLNSSGSSSWHGSISSISATESKSRNDEVDSIPVPVEQEASIRLHR